MKWVQFIGHSHLSYTDEFDTRKFCLVRDLAVNASTPKAESVLRECLRKLETLRLGNESRNDEDLWDLVRIAKDSSIRELVLQLNWYEHPWLGGFESVGTWSFPKSLHRITMLCTFAAATGRSSLVTFLARNVSQLKEITLLIRCSTGRAFDQRFSRLISEMNRLLTEVIEASGTSTLEQELRQRIEVSFVCRRKRPGVRQFVVSDWVTAADSDRRRLQKEHFPTKYLPILLTTFPDSKRLILRNVLPSLGAESFADVRNKLQLASVDLYYEESTWLASRTSVMDGTAHLSKSKRIELAFWLSLPNVRFLKGNRVVTASEIAEIVRQMDVQDTLSLLTFS